MRKRQKKHNHRDRTRALGTKLRLEELESRRVLAAVVTAEVMGGSLFIEAINDEDTSIEISQDTPGSDTFFVKGKDGTTVNGYSGKQEFTGITKDIDVVFRDGNDKLDVKSEVVVPRDLIVDGEDGNDEVIARADVDVGRHVDLHLGDGNNTVDFKGPHDVGRDFLVKTTHGADEVKLTDGDIGRNVNLDLGKGMNTVSIDPTEIDKHLTVKSRYALDLDLEEVTVYGNTTITSRGGDDIVDIDDSELMGKVTINLKGGSNELAAEDLDVGGNFFYTGGSGVDMLQIDDCDFGGKFNVATKGGNDIVKIERRSAGDDGKTDFDGRVDINLGGGDDELAIGKNDPNKKARFHDAVFLNGGGGLLDDLNLLGNDNNFDSSLDITNWEIV